MTRKFFLSIVAVISLIIFSPKISFGAEQFSRDLSFGFQQDPDVMKLQEFLASEELYSGPITGNFFSLTLKAVKAFQSREGITPAAGYFGPKTRVRANALIGVQIQASEQQAAIEGGQSTTQSTTPQTTNNSISNTQLQLETLLKQVALLQQQLKDRQDQIGTNLQIQDQVSSTSTLAIEEVNVTPNKSSAKIQWQTSKPAESKIFISGGNLSQKMFLSESGLSSNHIVNVSSLSPTTNYSYEITAINELGFVRKSGGFTTLDAFAPDISIDKEEIKNDGQDFVTVRIITKLTNGKILQNKSLKIKTGIYGSSGTVASFEDDESKSSDSQGIIIFTTRPTSYYDRCGMGMTITIIDDEDNSILFSKDVKIINVQPISPVSSSVRIGPVSACP